MKTKLVKFSSIILALILLFCSCGTENESTYTKILHVKEHFSDDLTHVQIYSSLSSEGNDGHVDRDLISALLGEDGKFPAEMDLCEQYSFFCATDLNICEVWAIKCRTYSSARDIEAVFERRRVYLSKQDYDKDSNIAAAVGAKVLRDGKNVYFAAAEHSNEILKFMCEQ